MIKIRGVYNMTNIKTSLFYLAEPKLVAKKMECAGTAKEEIFTGYHDLTSCQKSCATKTDMFILGTNEFGWKRCRSDGKCRCYCEVRTKTRCVKYKRNNGYNLYTVRGNL